MVFLSGGRVLRTGTQSAVLESPTRSRRRAAAPVAAGCFRASLCGILGPEAGPRPASGRPSGRPRPFRQGFGRPLLHAHPSRAERLDELPEERRARAGLRHAPQEFARREGAVPVGPEEPLEEGEHGVRSEGVAGREDPAAGEPRLAGCVLADAGARRRRESGGAVATRGEAAPAAGGSSEREAASGSGWIPGDHGGFGPSLEPSRLGFLYPLSREGTRVPVACVGGRARDAWELFCNPRTNRRRIPPRAQLCGMRGVGGLEEGALPSRTSRLCYIRDTGCKPDRTSPPSEGGRARVSPGGRLPDPGSPGLPRVFSGRRAQSFGILTTAELFQPRAGSYVQRTANDASGSTVLSTTSASGPTGDPVQFPPARTRASL